MFHIGKVIEVLSAEEKGSKSSDNATHALIEMWDENLIIFKVNGAIARDVKEGSYVLVDYSPVPVGGAPVPKHEIIAIVSEAKGKKILSKMRDSLEEKKRQKFGPGDSSAGFNGKMIG
ncbi:MAG TPA: hypothetical protein VJG83_03475 [archaeon]|nr:hypothetical protein [archaeon]